MNFEQRRANFGRQAGNQNFANRLTGRLSGAQRRTAIADATAAFRSHEP